MGGVCECRRNDEASERAFGEFTGIDNIFMVQVSK